MMSVSLNGLFVICGEFAKFAVTFCENIDKALAFAF